jgi:hypothetical protein
VRRPVLSPSRRPVTRRLEADTTVGRHTLSKAFQTTSSRTVALKATCHSSARSRHYGWAPHPFESVPDHVTPYCRLQGDLSLVGSKPTLRLGTTPFRKRSGPRHPVLSPSRRPVTRRLEADTTVGPRRNLC